MTLLNINVAEGTITPMKEGGLKFAQEIKFESKETSAIGVKVLGVTFKVTYDPSIQ